MSTDWIPAREQDFVDLCRKWKAGLESQHNMTAFGWNPGEVSETLGHIGAFLDAWTVYETDDSSKNHMAKNVTLAAAKSAMRDFANTSIRFNKQMKPEEKLDYGIRPVDPTHTETQEPGSYPEARVDTSVIRQLTFHFWDSVTKKRGKPHGIHGAEIRWAILDHPPASVKELINSEFDTASPFTLKFDESDRGKRVYFCLRWESTNNKKGPFGEIYSAIIP